ncbi:unnamed protein product [Mytilus coruscus]|uniref:Uncharacterized protein n=1 Tax=Mytilus coruscus TaxID=42192 RepID=A0A6J8ASU9_MYTCO|nr:unnamed protein product [Mytilus coruscus]
MPSLFAHESPQDWDDHIPYLLMAYRSTEHASTKCSPNLLMLGREITMPIDLIAGPTPEETEHYCPIQYVEWLKSAMATAFDFANEHLKVAAKIQKRDYDIGLKERGYEVGDWVWRWYLPDAGQKLKLGWTGPYLVVNKISPVTYGIQKSIMADEFVLDLEEDEKDVMKYKNTKLRPIWEPMGSKTCNVPNYNVQLNSFDKYMKHWIEVHVERIFVYACNVSTERFRKKERAMKHASVIHREERNDNNIKRIEVNNYKYKDDYGTLPYRKGTPVERRSIYEREKRKAQEGRKLLKEKIEKDRGFN